VPTCASSPDASSTSSGLRRTFGTWQSEEAVLTTATMKRRPTTPGEMLLEEFLRPAGLTQVALAAKMRVPIQRVNGIISGRRAVTAETAILLSRALGTTPELWLNLQVAVDLWDAQQRMPRGRVVARARAPARSIRRRNR
jgi:addiction module HigA family antidote